MVPSPHCGLGVLAPRPRPTDMMRPLQLELDV